MPSMKHEGLLLLFRNRPTLAPELLRDALGVAVPAFTEARVESAELTEVAPTEYRADLVVLLVDGKPVYAIVVEVQLKVDQAKRATWPLYLTSLRSRVSCPTALLVVAPKRSVAQWAAQPIDLGHPGFVLQPLVMGPDALPTEVDPKQVKADPELGVLSVMAHGSRKETLQAALVTMGVVRGLDGERAKLYADLMMMSLPKALRAALEKLMQSGTYQYQSEFAKRYVAQGRAEGQLVGQAKAVLLVLKARGLSPTEAQRKRILGATDAKEVDRWLLKAAVAASVEEVFSTKPLRKAGAKASAKRTKRGKR